MKTSPAVAALLALLSVSHAVDAQPSVEVDATALRRERPHRRHHVRMALELGAMFAIGHRWYWRDGGEPNRVDWQLGFGGDALAKKLTSVHDGWRFDGNEFNINAVGHPAFGTLTHFLARENGYSVGESFLISTLASGSWEMFIEWAEYGSLNDLALTSPVGIPVGETVYQVIHHARETRYELAAGGGTENRAAFAVLAARGELDRIPTAGEGRFAAGQRVGFAAELTADGGMRGIEAGAKATLGGWYRNRAESALRVGVATEFDYRDLKDRPERAWNQQAIMAIGPSIDLQLRHQGVTVDVGSELYADFALVTSQAYARWRADHAMVTMRNVMQTWDKPYYYAAGLSVDPRVNLAFRGYKLGGKLTASAFRSLDGHDRDEETMTDRVHFRDTEARAEAWIGYELRSVSITVNGRANRRAGSVGGVDDSAIDRTVVGTLAYRL